MWQEEYEDADYAEWAQQMTDRLICRAAVDADEKVPGVCARVKKYVDRINAESAND